MADACEKKVKRGADTYLTHDNWDQDDDKQEEAGTFKAASEEILTTRVFKKAKRRGATATEGEETEKKSTPFGAFSGFSGFGTTPSSNGLSFGVTKPETNGADPPSLFSDAVKPSPTTTFSGFSFKPATKSDDDKPEQAAAPVVNFWAGADSKDKGVDFFASRDKDKPVPPLFDSHKEQPLLDTNHNKTEESNSITDKKEEEAPSKDENKPPEKSKSESESLEANGDQGYMNRLASLNVSVLNWIKQHVAKNPCIDLTPVFKDYEKYLKELENMPRKPSKENITSTAKTKVDNALSIVTPANAFKTPENQVTPAPAVGQVKTASVFASTPISSEIGSLPSTAPKFSSTMFSPSMFAPLNSKPTASVVAVPAAPPVEASAGTAADDEDKPPEPERKIIEEKDAFHQIRCKLFYKKDSQYKDMGIGMLYLKKKEDSEKTQLLVRMETSTGNVLLNINLSSSIPMTRIGKNNISLVTVPNPPVFLKPEEGDNALPLSYLIRVKGTTEADELHEKMQEAAK